MSTFQTDESCARDLEEKALCGSQIDLELSPVVLEALLTIVVFVLVVWVLLDDYSHFKITVIEAVVTLVTVSLAGWVIILSSENFSLSTIEYGDLLIALGITFVIIRFIRKHVSMSRQLDQYLKKDFSIQEGWNIEKTQALENGVDAGHDLERLSKTLHHSEASIRGKLVSMKIYDQYLERQVALGGVKFEEWRKLSRKIGKDDPTLDSEQTGSAHQTLPPDWKMVQSLSENWFDPRLEFCETFYTSPVSRLPDPSSQHNVLKHIAAFLNTAGGHVLIGVGKEGKILGLFDDDLRTIHHYQHRLDETIRKTLGAKAAVYIKTHMIRWGSEDVCLIVCKKADFKNGDNDLDNFPCVHQKYNEMMGEGKNQKLIYRRVNAQTLPDPIASTG